MNKYIRSIYIQKFVTLYLTNPSSFQGEGFIELIKFLEPQYKVPCRTTITTRIEEMHKKSVNKSQELLKNEDVTFTTDNWTSIANEGYITTTSHFINAIFEMHARVLSTVGMPERHTGKNIADRLVECAKHLIFQVIK